MVGRHLIQNEAALDLVKVNHDCIFDKAITKEIHLLKRNAYELYMYHDKRADYFHFRGSTVKFEKESSSHFMLNCGVDDGGMT